MTARAATAPARRVRSIAAVPVRDPEPTDLATGLNAPRGLDLVIEMAHDLRSPLTSILFLAETMQRGDAGPVSEAQRRSLALIYSAALSLCTAASDVLELARGGHQLVDRQPQAFSLAELMVSVRDMVLPLAEQKGLDVRLVHAVPDRRVGHPRALARALLNLATNAVKYTDSGFVEIAAQPDSAGGLLFSVEDTGSGLDTDALKTLCQPLRQASADLRHHFSSCGLGLAICRKLVRAMGGELQVETARGQGSRFFFALELPPAAVAA